MTESTKYSQDERTALFTCCLATRASQTPSLCTLFHPCQSWHPNSPESSLFYVSPTQSTQALLSAPTMKNSKKKKKKKCCALWCKPKCWLVWFTGLHCGQQQLKSVTPGPHPSGFQHQPWPLTHTKLQPRVWKHASGKCSNVSETLELYKIICWPSAHMHNNTTTLLCICTCAVVVNVSRATTLPSCGFVCVCKDCMSCTHT